MPTTIHLGNLSQPRRVCLVVQTDEADEGDEASALAASGNRRELRGRAGEMAENLDAVLLGGQV